MSDKKKKKKNKMMVLIGSGMFIGSLSYILFHYIPDISIILVLIVLSGFTLTVNGLENMID